MVGGDTDHGGSKVAKVAKAASSFWSIGNVLKTVVGFVPIVGSVMDIVEGVANGDGKLVALGLAGLVLDAVTLGGASFVKGGIKVGIKSMVRNVTVKTATAKTVVKQVVKEIPEILFDGLTKAQRVAKSATRPKFRKGVVEKVWESSKNAKGKVVDPNTGEVLSWDKFKGRFNQWHMGHTPGNEWRKLRQKFIDGEKTWKQVMDEYNDAGKYLPEAPKSNMSGKFEAKD